MLMSIVLRPLRHFQHVLRLLQLLSWPPLLAHLSYTRQKEVAAQLVGVALAQVGSCDGDEGLLTALAK